MEERHCCSGVLGYCLKKPLDIMLGTFANKDINFMPVAVRINIYCLLMIFVCIAREDVFDVKAKVEITAIERDRLMDLTIDCLGCCC